MLHHPYAFFCVRFGNIVLNERNFVFLLKDKETLKRLSLRKSMKASPIKIPFHKR